MDGKTFLQCAIHEGFIEPYGPGQCVKSRQPKRLLSDVGNKSLFEGNQNNINPVRCVAVGSVLMGRKTGSTTTQENKEKKVFFPLSCIQHQQG